MSVKKYKEYQTQWQIQKGEKLKKIKLLTSNRTIEKQLRYS